MISKWTVLCVAAGAAILAGCEQQAAENQAQGAAANAAANDVAEPAPAAAAGNSTAGPAAGVAMLTSAPLERDAAVRAMKERHDNYEKIGDAMKLVTRQLKSDTPELDRVRAGAATIADLAPKAISWFPAGTGPDVGKTHAKAEIWQKPEDFAAKHAAFVTAANNFRQAAAGTDLAAIRAAHGKLGGSCKACHDLYKTED